MYGIELEFSAVLRGAAAMGEGMPCASQDSKTEAAVPGPQNEIYALKYASPSRAKLAAVLWNKGWDEDIGLYLYLWALTGKDETIVVDAGAGLNETYDELSAKATSIDLVFPGHDMSLATDYPRVAQDVTRFV